MKRKTILTLAILLTLLVSLFGMVSADGEIDPEGITDETDTTEVVEGQKFWTHPVVKLLSAYFDRDTEEDGEETEEEECVPTADVVCEPTEDEDGEPESGLGPIGEEIAAYHEDGMGFGVLVKIYSMLEVAHVGCDKAPEGDEAQATAEGTEAGDEIDYCALTADDLVTDFQGGMGLGQLYKKYDIEPVMKGVGHVKQCLNGNDKHCPAEPEVTDDTDETQVEDQDQDGIVDESFDTTNGKEPKGKPDKVKTPKNNLPKGKGPKK